MISLKIHTCTKLWCYSNSSAWKLVPNNFRHLKYMWSQHFQIFPVRNLNIIRTVTFGGGNITECSYRGVWNDNSGRCGGELGSMCMKARDCGGGGGGGVLPHLPPYLSIPSIWICNGVDRNHMEWEGGVDSICTEGFHTGGGLAIHTPHSQYTCSSAGITDSDTQWHRQESCLCGSWVGGGGGRGVNGGDPYIKRTHKISTSEDQGGRCGSWIQKSPPPPCHYGAYIPIETLLQFVWGHWTPMHIALHFNSIPDVLKGIRAGQEIVYLVQTRIGLIGAKLRHYLNGSGRPAIGIQEFAIN